MRFKIEEYLIDAKGNKSSSRLFSWILLKFFMRFNIIAPILGLGTIYLMDGKIDPNIILTGGIIWLVFDTILGIMIFAPKQMSKISEIKELIELAKSK